MPSRSKYRVTSSASSIGTGAIVGDAVRPVSIFRRALGLAGIAALVVAAGAGVDAPRAPLCDGAEARRVRSGVGPVTRAALDSLCADEPVVRNGVVQIQVYAR